MDVTVVTTVSDTLTEEERNNRLGCVEMGENCEPNGQITRIFRATSVVMAIGGKQEVPHWIQEAGPTHAAFLTSDFILSKEGLLFTSEFLNKLKQNTVDTNSKTNTKLNLGSPKNVTKSPKRVGSNNTNPEMSKVIIVGGSHSAFSVAWALISHIFKNLTSGDANSGKDVVNSIISKNSTKSTNRVLRRRSN